MTGSVSHLLMFGRDLPTVLDERNLLADDARSNAIQHVRSLRLVNEEDPNLSCFRDFGKFLVRSPDFVKTMRENSAKASSDNWPVELQSQSSNTLTQAAVTADF